MDEVTWLECTHGGERFADSGGRPAICSASGDSADGPLVGYPEAARLTDAEVLLAEADAATTLPRARSRSRPRRNRIGRGPHSLPMRPMPIRTAALVLALAIPTTAAATERGSSLLVMRAEEPVAPVPPPLEPLPATGPQVAGEPPVAEAPTEPSPVEAEPEVTETATPAPVYTPDDREAIYEAARAVSMRETGANAMVGTGLVTVGGVVLILAGFGATATAVKRSTCDTNLCATEDRRVVAAARVTVAGLMVSGMGAVGFVAAAAVYGVGTARVRRTRAGSTPAFAIAPSHHGAALSLQGRF